MEKEIRRIIESLVSNNIISEEAISDLLKLQYIQQFQLAQKEFNFDFEYSEEPNGKKFLEIYVNNFKISG